MNVTRSTFTPEVEALIAESIRSSDFVAVDCEFSGLDAEEKGSGGNLRPLPCESVQFRYDKRRRSAESFALLQIGICCFTWDEAGKLTAKPFNVPIFPASVMGARDRRFLFQTSSLRFLGYHNFDFNQWVKEGVPYVSKRDENHVRTALEMAHKQKQEKTSRRNQNKEKFGSEAASVSLKPHEMSYMTQVNAKVSLLEATRSSSAITTKFQMDTKGRPYLVLEPSSGRQRFLVHHFMPEHIFVSNNVEDNLDTYKRGSQTSRLRLTLVSGKKQKEEEKSKIMVAEAASVFTQADEAVGFRRLFDVLCAEKKPLIVHNGLGDLLHIFDKFIGDLPDSYEEFCRILHDTLPLVYDSKVLVERMKTTVNLPHTSLGDAFVSMVECSSSHIAPHERWNAAFAPGFDRYADKESVFHHEAGYDAYLTGCLAAVVICRDSKCLIGEQPPDEGGITVSDNWRQQHQKSDDDEELLEVENEGEQKYNEDEEEEGMSIRRALCSTLESHSGANRLYLPVYPTSIHLPGPTPEPDVGLFLFVSGFPTSTRTQDLQRLFTGGYMKEGEGKMWVHWLGGQSILLECSNRAQAERILNDYKQFSFKPATSNNISINNCRVAPLNGLVEIENVTAAANPKRKRSFFSASKKGNDADIFLPPKKHRSEIIEELSTPQSRGCCIQ
eukprot:281138_1